MRIPGAFHSEMVLVNDRKLEIYLLDMNMQSPTVQNSVLEAAVEICVSDGISSCKA